jgi:hypothetical protein
MVARAWELEILSHPRRSWSAQCSGNYLPLCVVTELQLESVTSISPTWLRACVYFAGMQRFPKQKRPNSEGGRSPGIKIREITARRSSRHSKKR